MASKNRNTLLRILTPITIGVIAVVFVFSCETENTVANLALKTQGKTYVYSKLGTFLTESSIAKKQSPTIFPFIPIFVEDKGLFVAPKNLEAIANVIGGNYAIFPYQEKSYEGYLTKDKTSLYSSTIKNVATDVVGEQIREFTMSLTTPLNSKTLKIVYQFNPKSGEYKAIKNCVLKSFWITSSYQPGETVTTSEDFIMVNLNSVVDFYDNQTTLELNVADQMLYIIAAE